MPGITDAIQGHVRIGLDTPIFIYHLESVPNYVRLTSDLFSQLIAGTFQGTTSTITLLELQVQPLRLGLPHVANHYEAVLTTLPNLTIVDLDRDIARRAAELRAVHQLTATDALQIGACLVNGATAFVTNDLRLRRINELQIVMLDDVLAANGQAT